MSEMPSYEGKPSPKTFRTKILAPIGLAVAGGLVFCLAAAPYSPARAQSCTSWQIPEDVGTTLYFWERVSATQVRRCLADGADLRALSQRGSNVLHFAARMGNAEAVKALIEAGSNVNAQNKNGVTPIHFAGLAATAEAVKVLIEAGSNVNAQNKNGVTPIHFAGLAATAEAVKVLISAGANVNAQGKRGVTPIHFAAKGGNTEAVKVLIAAGANVNATVGSVTPDPILGPREGDTPLHRAMRYSGTHAKRIPGEDLSATSDRISLEVTKVLLAAGANIDARDPRGMTPLIMVVRGRPETAKALIAAGARVDVQDNWGETALSRAAVAGKVELVSALLDAGADGCARTASGETMFDRMQLAQKRHEESKFESGPDLRGTDAWRRLRGAARRLC